MTENKKEIAGRNEEGDVRVVSLMPCQFAERFEVFGQFSVA